MLSLPIEPAGASGRPKLGGELWTDVLCETPRTSQQPSSSPCGICSLALGLRARSAQQSAASAAAARATAARRSATCRAAAAAGAGAPAQQQDPQQPPPRIRTGINYIRVDVIVTDRQGNPVLDLKQDEFRIKEDGKPQTIETFSVVKIDAIAQQIDGPPPREIRRRSTRRSARRSGPTSGCSSSCWTTITCGAATTWSCASRSSTSSRTSSRRRTWSRSCIR